VSDTDGGEALPLLAYTLAELAEGVERGGRLLLSRYEHLGGVRGTLARQWTDSGNVASSRPLSRTRVSGPGWCRARRGTPPRPGAAGRGRAGS